MKKRRWGLLIMVAALVIASVLAIESTLDKRAKRKREIEYQSTVKKYSDAVKPGSTRREVESYLRPRGLALQRMCCVGKNRTAYADLVKIGEEKAPWYCSEYNVYAAFVFKATEPHAGTAFAWDSDRLVSVTLFPWLEGCL